MPWRWTSISPAPPQIEEWNDQLSPLPPERTWCGQAVHDANHMEPPSTCVPGCRDVYGINPLLNLVSRVMSLNRITLNRFGPSKNKRHTCFFGGCLFWEDQTICIQYTHTYILYWLGFSLPPGIGAFSTRSGGGSGIPSDPYKAWWRAACSFEETWVGQCWLIHQTI